MSYGLWVVSLRFDVQFTVTDVCATDQITIIAGIVWIPAFAGMILNSQSELGMIGGCIVFYWKILSPASSS